MKIEKQKNSNNGDVYNIEKVNGSVGSQHVNIQQHLSAETTISKKDVERCNGERIALFTVGVIGFIADISDIFPNFSWPWWVWILLFIASFFYLGFKYGDAFSIKKNIKVQTAENGKVTVLEGNNYVINRVDAPCIYPNCRGKICPIDVPEEYEGPYKLMGKCSIANLQHGYVVDDNLQAYPMDIYEEFNKKA